MGKRKMKYLANKTDYLIYMQQEYYKNNTVTDINGNKIRSSDFSVILKTFSLYQDNMSMLKDRYKLNPKLIEIVLLWHLKKERFESLRKRITSEFRFMENENIEKLNNGVIKVKGLINGRIETIFINDNFINYECAPLMNDFSIAIKRNQTEFIVNGVKIGLYDLITDVLTKTAMSRFKGLGEMNDWQLRESTMSADSRTLIQYTVNSIDETMRIIRQYDSNKSLILDKLKERGIERSELIGL